MISRACWRFAYAVAWLIHWPVVVVGGAGLGVCWLAGVLARGICACAMFAHRRAYLGGNK